MKENILQALFAAAIGAITAYLNVLVIPIAVLIAVMIIDYISGMTEAFINKTISSRVGVIGIIKKVGYFAVVAVAMVVDYLISSALGQCGINLQINYCFSMIAAIWLIINELISILENLSEIGVPLPKFLTVIVKKLKISIDNKTNIDETEE